jgi:hypothetical protein
MSFTTSKDKVPYDVRAHGCHQKESAALSHYVFTPDTVVGDNDFSIPRKTYLLFQGNFHSLHLSHFDKYVASGSITHECNLRNEEFIAILNCYKNSMHIRRKNRPLLEAMIQAVGK